MAKSNFDFFYLVWFVCVYGLVALNGQKNSGFASFCYPNKYGVLVFLLLSSKVINIKCRFKKAFVVLASRTKIFE